MNPAILRPGRLKALRMEPSLYRYVLRQSWRQQIALVLLALVSFPFLYVFYELPKTIVNRAIAPEAAHFPVSLLGLELSQRGYLFALCGVLLLLVLVNQAFKYAINVYKGITAEKILRQFRADLYGRVLKFPLPVFRRMSQGKIIPMITGEVETLGGFFGDILALPAFQGGTLVVVLGFLFVQNPIMAAAAVSLYPAQIILIPRLQAHVNRLAKERVRLIRGLSDRIGETVQGVEEIRVHGTAAQERSDFRARLDEIFRVRYSIYLRKFVIKAINNFIQHLGPFFFYSIGGYLVIQGELDIGTLLAAVAAHKDLAAPWRELLNYYQTVADARIRYQQVVAQFDPEGMVEIDATLPGAATDGAIRISHLTVNDDWGRPALDDVSFTLPAGQRIAFMGGTGSGADEAAMALAGLLAPERGQIDAPAGEIGYVGPSGYVFAGSLGHNLFYGCEPATLGSDTDLMDRGLDALAVVGLEDDVYRFGLRSHIDPAEDADLAAVLLEARGRFKDRIVEAAGPSGDSSLVEFFDADCYNANATLAENLLFGVATDETFAIGNLAGQPYVRQVLDEAGLTEPLLDMGYIIASTMVEMFAGLPAGHPFFEQFSFISSGDLPYFQSLTQGVERHAVMSLGDEDRARLLALPFKLIPARHRIGALKDDTKRRILFARRLFAANLPDDLKPGISFFDTEHYVAAASLADNILFGKVVHGTVGASRMVDRLIGEIVEKLGVARRITAAGLNFDVGVGGARLTGAQRQKLALARGLVKQPTLFVLVNATSGLDADSEGRVLDYLLDERRGPETVIWSVHQPALALRFDSVVVFADGHVTGSGPPGSVQNLRGLDDALGGTLDDAGAGPKMMRGAGE